MDSSASPVEETSPLYSLSQLDTAPKEFCDPIWDKLFDESPSLNFSECASDPIFKDSSVLQLTSSTTTEHPSSPTIASSIGESLWVRQQQPCEDNMSSTSHGAITTADGQISQVQDGSGSRELHSLVNVGQLSEDFGSKRSKGFDQFSTSSNAREAGDCAGLLHSSWSINGTFASPNRRTSLPADKEGSPLTSYWDVEGTLDSFQLFMHNGLHRAQRPANTLRSAILTTLQALRADSALVSTLDLHPWLGGDRFREFVKNHAPNIDLWAKVNTSLLAEDVFHCAQLLLNFLSDIGHEQYTLGVVSSQKVLETANIKLYGNITNPENSRIVWIYQELTENCAHVYGFQQSQDHDRASPIMGTAISQPPQMLMSDISAQLKRKRDTNEVEVEQPSKKAKVDLMQEFSSAVPHDTDLPFEHLNGITSEELITFFPNHVLTWPAICARVCEDGYTAMQIANIMNEHWSRPRQHGDQADVVTASAVQLVVESMNREFHNDSRWSAKTRPRVMADIYAETPSEMSKASACRKLRHPWPLVELGRHFGDRGYDVPGAGLFRDKVAQSLDSQGRIGSEILSPSPQGSNPPALPQGWTSAVQGDASIHFFEVKVVSQVADSIYRTIRNEAHTARQSASLTRHWMGPATRDDPNAIMMFPSRCTGEVLLWLISRRGGKQRITEVFEKVNGNIREANEALPEDSVDRVKELDRTAFSQRKRSALKQRAKKSGRTYQQEKENFNLYEAFNRPTHKRHI